MMFIQDIFVLERDAFILTDRCLMYLDFYCKTKKIMGIHCTNMDRFSNF